MTDEEFLFKQTEKERKKLGYGDKHKKRGGGKYVRLPSDNLSKKEKQAMNGEVFSFNPRKFYTWDEFRNFPMEYQIKYINSMLLRYDCGITHISEIVFGKSKGWLQIYFTRAGQIEYINNKKDCTLTKKKARSAEKLKADVEAARNETIEVETQQKPNIIPEETQQKPEEAAELVDREDVREVVFDKMGLCSSADEVDKMVDSIPAADAPSKKNDFHNIALLLQSLAGTGAKLTIEVTL